MADKRISQLIDRGVVVNNDVIPIVVSGATTTNKATISSIQTFMQSNLDVGVTSVGITLGSSGTDVNVTGSPVTSSGNITINFPTASATNRGLLSAANWSTFNSKVSSVGLSMPSAFSVANSPITGSGTIAVTGAGTVSQYIRGDGSLADFPSGGGGGGSSVSYYLNGSVSQGTIGGIAYQEMNKVPVLGAGTDFTIAADGYIASFITDAGDPALLEIPAGNWNFETYLQASSGGGTPSFYIELYKVNSGGTATLIASNSATPELIAFGTTTTPYFSALAVPQTTLALTDRLALRYYVTHSGRTITLHTENTTLCQIVTTFTTGLTALNGLTAQVQNFATGTSGTDFNISSSVNTHTFNLPDASASARGVVTTGSQTFAGAKTFNSSVTANSLIKTGGTSSQFLKADGSVDSSTYLTTGSAGSTYVPYSGASANVDLGVYNLTASAIIANGSGSNSGIIHLESNAFHSLVNGYGSISSGTTNQFNLYQTTGAGVFRCAIFSLNSITASATRTYTLPDADGTLALTSSLGAYLPLTGGTLTGALNGTSATFSSSVTSNATTSVSFYSGTYVSNSLGDGSFATYSGRIRENLSYGLNIDLYDRTAATWRTPLSFNNTGGAATFSSSVTATRLGIGSALNSILATATFDKATAVTTFTTASNYLQIGAGENALNSTRLIGFGYSITANTNQPAYIGYLETSNTGETKGSLIFGTRDVTTDTAPTTRLTIASTGAATFSSPNNLITDGSDSNIEIRSTTAYNANIGGSLGFGGFFNTTSSANFAVIAGKKENATINNLSGYLAFYTRGALTDPIERMRINSSGNVGIGTATPTSFGSTNTTLSVNNINSGGGGVFETMSNGNSAIRMACSPTDCAIWEPRNVDMLFATNNNPRMRITSGGYLKASNNGVYNNATGTFHELNQNLNGASSAILVHGGTSDPYGLEVNFTGHDPNNATNYMFGAYKTSGGFVWIYRIFSNGTVSARSDARWKKNIETTRNGYIDDLCKLRVVKYNWYNHEDDAPKELGLIAQEVEEVFPNLIQIDPVIAKREVEQEDGTIIEEEYEDGVSRSIKTSVLPFMLLKAMQEQQEQIKELQIQIDSLKNQMQ